LEYAILITKATSHKARTFLNAIATCEVITQYKPCDVLILYGLGGDDRRQVAADHLASGKPFVAFDLAYWDRHAVPRKFRMSINGNHPKGVMQGPYPGAQRFESSALKTGNVADPSGPIMLVGIGPKSNAVGAAGWVKNKAKELAAAFPGRQIVYRPKPNKPHEINHYPLSTGPIDAALEGISLVVCRHSNVAVDACRLGVPVVCDDGAAAAIYPSQLSDKDNQPDELTRLEFLHRLAWWQYSADEPELIWKWIKQCV
jgi:hypothetical protein